MFPTTYVDKTVCLESLVGIRTACAVGADYPFWIEDIEGVDVKKLGVLAKSSNPSGKDLANQLINNAARQMMGNIEMLLNNGYKLNTIIGDMCSTCTLLPNYTANTGIIVKSNTASRFLNLRITKLTILANVTDTKQITIDDGETPVYLDVALQAGVLMPVKLAYSTTKKSVKIFFTDSTVPLGQITCATTASCGCGGSATSNSPVTIKGLVAGIEGSTQYGFLPCVAVDCSYDSLVCNLIQQTPNTFGLAMLFKVGELYYDNKAVSDRNSDSVSFNEETKEEYKKNYAKQYKDVLQGTSQMLGLKKIINDYLKTYRADKCILCDSKLSTAYATG